MTEWRTAALPFVLVGRFSAVSPRSHRKSGHMPDSTVLARIKFSVSLPLKRSVILESLEGWGILPGRSESCHKVKQKKKGKLYTP